MSDKVKLKLKPSEGVKVKIKAGSLQSALNKLAKLKESNEGSESSGSDQGV